MSSTATLLWGCGLALFAVAAAASAHEAPHPKRVALHLSRERISVAIELLIPAGEAARSLRQSFDRDRNGALDAAEQAALGAYLLQTAALRTKLSVDGREVALRKAAAPAVEHGDAPASSTALLSVRAVLEGSWPAGSGDWLGRRTVVLSDEAATATGHVPAAATCTGCSISSSSSPAVFHRDDRGREHALGAQVAPGAPLELKIRFAGGGCSSESSRVTPSRP